MARIRTRQSHSNFTVGAPSISSIIRQFGLGLASTVLFDVRPPSIRLLKLSTVRSSLNVLNFWFYPFLYYSFRKTVKLKKRLVKKDDSEVVGGGLLMNKKIRSKEEHETILITILIIDTSKYFEKKSALKCLPCSLIERVFLFITIHP